MTNINLEYPCKCRFTIVKSEGVEGVNYFELCDNHKNHIKKEYIEYLIEKRDLEFSIASMEIDRLNEN